MKFVLMTKLPTAGKVKTRLIPPLSPQQAAEVHSIFLRHVAARLARLGELAICFDPPDSESQMRNIVQGDATYVAQSAGDLGARLARAHEALKPASLLFFGADSPDVPESMIRDAAQLLQDHDVVVGPSDDGGYWCLGLGCGIDARRLLAGIEWSSGKELSQTLAQARSLGYHVALTDAWSDVDRPDDLRRLVQRLRKSENSSDMHLWAQLQTVLPPEVTS